MIWDSPLDDLGPVVFPAPSALRILMMPFLLEDVQTIPGFVAPWRPLLADLIARGPCQKGTAYLTIDEQFVPAGSHHRRPGLHVDGWADDSDTGIWGGGWGGRDLGMLVAASHHGSDAYPQTFDGRPHRFGDCAHLKSQCGQSMPLLGGRAYHLAGLTVHATRPMLLSGMRQFLRVSMPSPAGWPASNTPNPFGILPTGPIMAMRPSAFSRYRPTVQGTMGRDAIPVTAVREALTE